MHDGQTCHKLSQILEEVKYIPSLSARGARNVWPSHLPLDVCNQDGVFYLFFFFPLFSSKHVIYTLSSMNTEISERVAFFLGACQKFGISRGPLGGHKPDFNPELRVGK